MEKVSESDNDTILCLRALIFADLRPTLVAYINVNLSKSNQTESPQLKLSINNNTVIQGLE